MSLEKFTTKKLRVEVGAKTWIVNGHYRNCDGEITRATAAFLEEARGAHKRVRQSEEPATIRDLCFERKPSASRPISMRALRKAAGAPTWSKGRWRPKPRRILGAVFDLVLVRRVLSCAPRDALAAVLEVVPFDTTWGTHGYALRVVGNGWLAIVGSRIEERAKPLALGRRPAGLATDGRQGDD